MGCFHLLKVKCCGQTSRETGKLLKSSLEFFSGGFFVSGERIRFFSFPLANDEEIRILETLLLCVFSLLSELVVRLANFLEAP